MHISTAAAVALLASHAEASIGKLIADGMRRDSAALEQRLREIALMHRRAEILPRQNMNLTLGPGTATTMSQWDSEVTTACDEALSSLPEASNPSGTCTCYNIVSLDEATGVFYSDLRLYQLSTPSGDFANIAPQDIQVSLSYGDATATPITNQTAAQQFTRRQTISGTDSTSNNLTLLQQYYLLGQINQKALTAATNASVFEALVTPVLTLTGTNGAGQTVSTNVSSNEASFVTGVFSNATGLSSTAIAQLAVNDVVNGLANGTVAFVMPGVQLILAPIGLLITGVWTIIFVAAVGFGTFERMNYRELYKRGVARAGKGPMETF